MGPGWDLLMLRRCGPKPERGQSPGSRLPPEQCCGHNSRSIHSLSFPGGEMQTSPNPSTTIAGKELADKEGPAAPPFIPAAPTSLALPIPSNPDK